MFEAYGMQSSKLSEGMLEANNGAMPYLDHPSLAEADLVPFLASR